MNIRRFMYFLVLVSVIQTTNSKKGIRVTWPPHPVRTTPRTNTTRLYCPLTLKQDWPPMGRLVMTLAMAVFGTLFNGFFIATFFFDERLSRLGNTYFACMGVAEIIITGAVIPVPALLIMYGEWDTKLLCYFLQFLTEASTYSYSLFFMFASIETYVRVCRTPLEYIIFISIPLGLVSVLIFLIGFIFAGIGVYFSLDYDYCVRQQNDNFMYRIITFTVFYVITFFTTLLCLIFAIFKLKKRTRAHPDYMFSYQLDQDMSTTYMNIHVLFLYALFWAPSNLIVFFYPESSDSTLYHCVWLGIFRSVFCSFLYGTFNVYFREAFGHLYNYCFCKNGIVFRRPTRNRRGGYPSINGQGRVTLARPDARREATPIKNMETHDL